jgi:hypothetical protein
MKIVTADGSEKNKQQQVGIDNPLQKKTADLVYHQHCAQRNIKAAEQEKIKDAFQHATKIGFPGFCSPCELT